MSFDALVKNCARVLLFSFSSGLSFLDLDFLDGSPPHCMKSVLPLDLVHPGLWMVQPSPPAPPHCMKLYWVSFPEWLE